MNARVEKEIKTQAPVLGLIAVCATAIVAVAIVQAPYVFNNARPTLLGIYFIGSLLMSAMTFGNEFHLRTMSLLLSQPVARRQLWPEKMRVLAAVNAIGGAVVLVALMCTTQVRYDAGEAIFVAGKEMLVQCATLAFVPILFCCTTPYFTLISRSTLGGMVFSIFGGGMLLVLSGWIWDGLAIAGFGRIKDKLTFDLLDGPDFVFVILSLPYCALLYWMGRRRFLQLEVIDSQSLEASLPQGLETTLANFSAKFKSPFSRLLFKELRLQRISLLLTAAFCFFIAIERITWNASNSRTFVVAGTFCIYLFLFPVIVCATAVADEKTWGMKDWHLTLPPSLNQQWRVKWLVAFTLSMVLGAGLTWLLAYSGPWRQDMGLGWDPEMLSFTLLIAVALYAGSISTSTIRAFLLTFGMVAAYLVIINSSVNVLTSFRAEPTYVTPVFVIFYLLVEIYAQILHLLWKLIWNIIVVPAYLVTHSQEKAAAVSRWAELTIHDHLRMLVLLAWIAGFFWLMLRFARTNYRNSDLVKRKVARQLVILLLASLFLAIAIGSAKEVWHVPVM